MGDTKKSNRGGARPNSGRHKEEDPKDKVILYVRRSKILKASGRAVKPASLKTPPDQTKLKDKLYEEIDSL